MSRELDAAVAEKVMGNHVFSIGGDDPLQEARDLGDGHAETRILARYSTDIAAAWLVVEKLGLSVIYDSNRKQYIAMEISGGSMGGISYMEGKHVTLDERGPWLLIEETATYDELGFGATAPEAICKAALCITK